jgi:hypothetical protein
MRSDTMWHVFPYVGNKQVLSTGSMNELAIAVAVAIGE